MFDSWSFIKHMTWRLKTPYPCLARWPKRSAWDRRVVIICMYICECMCVRYVYIYIAIHLLFQLHTLAHPCSHVMSCHFESFMSLPRPSSTPKKGLSTKHLAPKYQYYINHKYVLGARETNPLPQKTNSIQRSPSRESHNDKSARFQQDPGPNYTLGATGSTKCRNPKKLRKSTGKVYK